jgi:hypothetical protein
MGLAQHLGDDFGFDSKVIIPARDKTLRLESRKGRYSLWLRFNQEELEALRLRLNELHEKEASC